MSDEPRKPEKIAGPLYAAKLSALAATNIKPITSMLQELERSSLHRADFAAAIKQIDASMSNLHSMTRMADLAKAIELQTSPIRLLNLKALNFKVSDSQSAMFKALEAQSARWRLMTESLGTAVPRFKLQESLAEHVSRSSLAWSTGLSESLRRINELGMLDARPNLASRLLGPSLVHARFAEETFALLKQSSEPRILKALNASLNLVDAQHVANAEILATLSPASVDDEVSSSMWELNAPFVQREELLAEPELVDEENIGHVVSRSPAAQEAEQARAVLLLTTDCNKASRTKGPSEIFKPTNKVLEVFGNLPWLIPHDERSLAEFIDGLYFVAYEGAGKDKLRFLQAHGGPLTPNDCDVIWCIKTLRNKWLRHDIDHGKESDIDKSWQSLDECLRRLGLQGFPRSSADYRLLHRRLLEEMKAFLSKLLNAI